MKQPIAPVLVQNLIRLATAYFDATAPTNKVVSLASISRLAHGDPPFFDKLIAGECSVTLRKYDEIIAWFDQKAKWPEGYSRPVLVDPRHEAPSTHETQKVTTDGKAEKRTGSRSGKAKPKKPVRAGQRAAGQRSRQGVRQAG